MPAASHGCVRRAAGAAAEAVAEAAEAKLAKVMAGSCSRVDEVAQVGVTLQAVLVCQVWLALCLFSWQAS